MITVRPAEGEDIPWMMDQLKAFDSFADFPLPLFPDTEQASGFLDNLIATQPVFVSEKEGELTGFIAGFIHPHMYNPSLTVLTELLWWVAPDHRGGRSGALLFQAFEDLGNREADVVIMTIEHSSPVNPLTLQKRGYNPCEYSFARATHRERLN